MDFSVRAKTAGCKDTSPLQGACCTNACMHRDFCKIKTTHLNRSVNVMKGLLMHSDQSGNYFQLKSFPDWNNYNHNDSSDVKMVFFQPESHKSGFFDDVMLNSCLTQSPQFVYSATFSCNIAEIWLENIDLSKEKMQCSVTINNGLNEIRTYKLTGLK